MGSAAFIKQVEKIIQEERPGLHRLIQRLRADGIILHTQAKLLLASPFDGARARTSEYAEDAAAINELKLGVIEAAGTVLERLVLLGYAKQPKSEALAIAHQAAFAVERSLAAILIDHLRRQNVLSWNGTIKIESSDELKVYNNFWFHAATFSWLSPLVKPKIKGEGDAPTPVLFHVCARTCTKHDVEGFQSRLERAGANKTSKMQFLSIIAAPNFDPDAFRFAKDKRHWLINLTQLFGDEALAAMVQIEDLLKNVVGDPTKANPNQCEQLQSSLIDLRTHPFIADLKSLSFETVVGLLVKNDIWEEVRLNLKVPFVKQGSHTDREVDVSGHRHSWDQIKIIECKAEHKDKKLSSDYINKFFTETVPAFIKAKCANPPSVCEAEIWTTGIVGDDARAALKALPLKGYIKRKILSREEILKGVPKTLASAKRLISTISEV